jgi:Fe-S cluster assembly protein SufD
MRRAEAARFLETNGFPTQRDEAFRFTPVREATRVAFSRVSAGTFAWTRASGADGAGVEIATFSDAVARHPALLEEHAYRVAELTDGFTALGAAFAPDGLVVIAERGARATLHVTHTEAADEALTLPRLFVFADRQSELTLVEEYENPGVSDVRLSYATTEVVVSEGARVEHIRIQPGASGLRSLGTLAVRQSRDSRYASRVFALGGALSRLDVRVALDGEGAECVLDGLYLGHDDTFVDHHTTIDHLRAHCTSRERYKGVLAGRSQAVFDGTIVVRPHAVKTEAHQENRNLLLSSDAVVHAKPHLRIDNDDVKCSHGATVGRLDPAQLFYLRSRGMDPSMARSVLTTAFAREIVDAVPHAATRRELSHRLSHVFPGGALEGLETEEVP